MKEQQGDEDGRCVSTTPWFLTTSAPQRLQSAAASSPRVVGRSSCAAGHDRPMLGPASALSSTEQMIDRPHGGGAGLLVCPSKSRWRPRRRQGGRRASLQVLCSWLALARGRGSACSRGRPPPSPGRAATSGRAEPRHIGCHLPQEQKQRLRHAVCPESVHFNMVINSLIHGCGPAGV